MYFICLLSFPQLSDRQGSKFYYDLISQLSGINIA
jgi:hypothetical protein